MDLMRKALQQTSEEIVATCLRIKSASYYDLLTPAEKKEVEKALKKYRK